MMFRNIFTNFKKSIIRFLIDSDMIDDIITICEEIIEGAIYNDLDNAESAAESFEWDGFIDLGNKKRCTVCGKNKPIRKLCYVERRLVCKKHKKIKESKIAACSRPIERYVKTVDRDGNAIIVCPECGDYVKK